MGLLQIRKKKWRQYNTFKGDLSGVLPNMMKQEFKRTAPYQKAGTGVTMFPLDEQAVFLSPIIDFHTRDVLAYVVGLDAKTDKMVAMLSKLKKQHGRTIKSMIIQ